MNHIDEWANAVAYKIGKSDAERAIAAAAFKAVAIAVQKQQSPWDGSLVSNVKQAIRDAINPLNSRWWREQAHNGHRYDLKENKWIR